MTAGEYFARERRRVWDAVPRGPFGPLRPLPPITVPSFHVLAELTGEPEDPAAETWLRDQLARLAARTEDNP
jgi:hypothetical protein